MPSAHAAGPVAPARRDLRSILFWSARWLIGGAEFHRAALSIAICDKTDGSGDRLIIQPRPGEEVYNETASPTGDEALATLAPKLLALFLSSDTRAIMKFVANRQPVAAKVVAAGVGIERSKCYVLLTELRDRGLIRDTGDGYEVADAEVWEAVRGATE